MGALELDKGAVAGGAPVHAAKISAIRPRNTMLICLLCHRARDAATLFTEDSSFPTETLHPEKWSSSTTLDEIESVAVQGFLANMGLARRMAVPP
jgi:hypothetical protein